MTQATRNPYAVLGLPTGASDQQVRRAYRHLAMRHHPDLHPDTPASERMRAINQAWEILSDPVRRTRYDAEAAEQRTPSYGHWSASSRPQAPAAQRAEAWAPAWTTPAGTRSYRSPTTLDDDRPGWSTAILMAAVCLLALVGLFAGILPAPLFGIAVLVIVRGIFARFD